VNRKRLTLLI